MRKGTKHTPEALARIRGTFEERFGPERAAEIKAKMSAARKGRTWEDIHGVEQAQQMRERGVSPEVRAQISASLTGRSYEEQAKTISAEERRAKISQTSLGRVVTEATRAKIGAANSGREFTPEHRAKLAEAKRGERNLNWKGGVEKPYPAEWNEVRLQALERDRYACVKCGITSNEWRRTHARGLHVDHINADKADLRLANLQTLCPTCHVHKSFGID